MAVSQSGQLSNASWATLYFTATETGTNTQGNYSNVQVQCEVVSTAPNSYYQGYIDLYLYIDGNLVRGGVNSDYVNKSGSGSYINIDLGTYQVPHNADGTKTVPIRVYSDWAGWGTVDVSANLPLTTIPRGATFTTTNGNLTIGSSKTLNWTNNANGYVKLGINVNGSSLSTYNTGQSTSKAWTPTSSEISTIYTRLGASGRTVPVVYTITTYSDSGYTSQLGNAATLNGTIIAPVNYANAVPTFSNSNISVAVTGNSVVKDGDGNSLQSTAWSTLLGSSAVLKGYSSVQGSVDTAATAKYSASMSYYTGTVGNNTSTINAIGNFPVFTQATDKTITVKAYDTRGDYKTVSKSLTYLNSGYVKPVITSCTIGRINQVGTTCTLDLAGTYYGTGYLSGQNNIGTANELHVKYKFKKTSEQNYGAWVDITNDCTISGTSFSYSGNLSTVFSADDFYDFQIVVYDYVDRDFSQNTITNGTPSLHIVKDGISVYGKYDTNVGGHLQVAGRSIDTQPLYYSCHIKEKLPTQTLPDAVATVIQFPSAAVYDPLSMHDVNQNNSRITVPVDGCYLVYGALRTRDAVSATHRILQISINGVSDIGSSAGVDIAGRYGQPVMSSYHLSAGDYVELLAYQAGTGGSIDITYASLGVILLGMD